MISIPSSLITTIQNAHHIVIVTGAGVSKESGIPTFRDADKGLWKEFNSEELATPQGFRKNPEKVTRWYDERRLQCMDVKPNPAHFALAELEKKCAARGVAVSILTQNIDRLHRAAGSQNVVELHGSLWVWFCIECGEEKEEQGKAFGVYPPRCAFCDGMRRPGVVWFGEQLPAIAMQDAYQALKRCDLFFTIGTSALVHPAAGFLYVVKEHGAKTVEINLEPTAHSGSVDWCLQGSAGDLLPLLVKKVFT